MEKKIQFIEVTPDELGGIVAEIVEKTFKKALFKNNEEELLTREETAEKLKISLVTLWKWTKDPTNPITSYGIGNKIYYKKNEVIKSLEQL